MKKKQTFCSAIVLSAGVAMAASTGVIAPEMRNTEGQTSEISTAFKEKVKAVSDHSNEAKEVPSPIEGVINNQFVDEATMKGDLMNMLAKFSKYLKMTSRIVLRQILWVRYVVPSSVIVPCRIMRTVFAPMPTSP